MDILKSTAELGYLDPSRIYNNKWSSTLSPELLCTICQNILWKPIACTTCENSFCARCIKIWAETKPADSESSCPFFCDFKEKRAPPILNSFLSKLQVHCAYAPNGCKKVVLYDALEKHEEECPYEKIPCRICQTPVSNRDGQNKHDARQCFQQMYENNPDQIQAQFMKLLDIVEASQKRIETLEKLLDIESEAKN